MTKPTEAELADKEKAELEDNLINIGKENADLSFLNDTLKAENEQLKAQINELRKTLEETKTFLDFNIELAQSDEYGNMEPANSYSYDLYRYVCFINDTLAKTAPQSLQEHDNEVIEKRIAELEVAVKESNDRLYEEREMWDRMFGDGAKKLELLELELKEMQQAGDAELATLKREEPPKLIPEPDAVPWLN